MALLCNFNKYTKKWKKQLMLRNIYTSLHLGPSEEWSEPVWWGADLGAYNHRMNWHWPLIWKKKELIAATERQPEMDSQMNAFQAAM